MRDHKSPRRVHARATAAAQPNRIEVGLVLMLVVAIFAMAWLSGRPAPSSIHTERVKVRVGESLWSVAKAHPMSGRSTAETVRLLVEINGLETTHVAAGSSLRVPATPVAKDDMVAMR